MAPTMRAVAWRQRALGCLAACLAGGAMPADDATVEQGLRGTWRNPQDSVHVEIAPCGATQCGIVMWANDKAKADARKGGTDPLIGINLLRNLVATGDGKWRARVFLPEFNKTVSGTIVMTDHDTFRARSCMLGIVCKTQIWKRVA